MYSLPNQVERKRWSQFVDGLDDLNRQQRVTAMRFSLLKNHAKFCAAQSTEKICERPWGDKSYLDKLENYGKKLDKQISALNRSYQLTQRGLAYMQSTKNDFSIVVQDGALSDSEIARATYSGDKLPEETELGWIAPIVIAGIGTVIIVVAAAWTAIQQSKTKQKALDVEIQKSTVKAETELAKSPDAFGRYAKYKKDIIKPATGLIDKLLGGGTSTSIMGIGLALIIGFVIFRSVQGQKQ